MNISNLSALGKKLTKRTFFSHFSVNSSGKDSSSTKNKRVIDPQDPFLAASCLGRQAQHINKANPLPILLPQRETIQYRPHTSLGELHAQVVSPPLSTVPFFAFLIFLTVISNTHCRRGGKSPLFLFLHLCHRRRRTKKGIPFPPRNSISLPFAIVGPGFKVNSNSDPAQVSLRTSGPPLPRISFLEPVVLVLVYFWPLFNPPLTINPHSRILPTHHHSRLRECLRKQFHNKNARKQGQDFRQQLVDLLYSFAASCMLEWKLPVLFITLGQPARPRLPLD